MPEHIEREALIAKMRRMPIPKQAGSGYTWLDNCAAGINAAIREVKSFPAASVEPVTYCWKCIHHGRCQQERIYESEGILRRYCCRGKRKDGE